MTFKHKLAHRLALLRAPAAALVLLAGVSCTEGDLGSLAPYESMTLSGDRVASISPKSVTIEAGQSYNFKSSSSTPEGVKWTSTGGTITSEGGFKSVSYGDFLVVSRVSLSGGEKVDTARVRVTPRGESRALSVSPRAAELLPGQSVHFTATATDAEGGSTPAKVNWKVTGGEMDRDGNYIAGTTPGTYVLVAFIPAAGVADTVSVTISASARRAVRLLLAPATAAVVTGGVIMYAASAQYEDGSTEPVWASFGTSGGGTITPSGQQAEFRAGSESGTFEITAKTQDGAMQATASVAVGLGGGIKEPDPVIDPPSDPIPTPLPGLTSDGAAITILEVGFDPTVTPSSECNGWLKGQSGCWWRYGPGQKVRTDVSARYPGVMELVFPAGLEPGWGQDMFGGWAKDGSQYREIDEIGLIKIPSADFENQLVGAKLFGLWGAGQHRPDAPIQVVGLIEGDGIATSIRSSFNIMFMQQDVVSRRLDQNLSRSTRLTANTWHEYRVRMRVNDIGVSNGKLEFWLDNVKILDYSDVVYRTREHTWGFFGRKWDPVWGGGGGTPKSRTDRLWINRLSIRGVPM